MESALKAAVNFGREGALKSPGYKRLNNFKSDFEEVTVQIYLKKRN
jgi:hypothetical protein